MIVIVDYGTGNLASVRNMIRKVGGDAVISSQPADIASAVKLVLPGVGAFDYGMGKLHELELVAPLRERAQTGVPLLGICLGMQLLSNGSDEGEAPGLGLIPARFRRFIPNKEARLRVPHVGWNTVDVLRENPILPLLEEEQRFYFVHSYYAECEHQDDRIATTTYDVDFTSAYGRGNVLGCQFHPEKSHRFGMALMKRFLEV
jgi:glutamine amidotransferase